MSEHEQTPPPRRRWLSRRTAERLVWAGLALAILLAVGLLWVVQLVGSKGSDAVASKDAIGVPAVANADRTLQLCGGSAGKSVAKALKDAGLCSTAIAVKDQASRAGVPTTIMVTSSVDPAQLHQLATEVVAEYCGARNECRPDPAVLVPLVADWLREHPPTQPKPSTADIRAAVQFVMSQNPAAFKGDPGQNGQDAPPVTDEQLAAQVAAYCSTGACTGKTGAQGVGLVTIDFRRDDSGTCRSVATLVNPADGSTSTAWGDQVNDLVCQPVPTTTTTEPPAGRGGGLLGGG